MARRPSQSKSTVDRRLACQRPPPFSIRVSSNGRGRWISLLPRARLLRTAHTHTETTRSPFDAGSGCRQAPALQLVDRWKQMIGERACLVNRSVGGFVHETPMSTRGTIIGDARARHTHTQSHRPTQPPTPHIPPPEKVGLFKERQGAMTGGGGGGSKGSSDVQKEEDRLQAIVLAGACSDKGRENACGVCMLGRHAGQPARWRGGRIE